MPYLTSVSNNHLFTLHLHCHLVIKVLHLTFVTGRHCSHVPPAQAVVSEILKVSSLLKHTLPFSTFNNFNYSFTSCLTAPTHFAVSNMACKRATLYDPPSCLIGTGRLITSKNATGRRDVSRLSRGKLITQG